MSSNCERCGKQFEFLEERTYQTSDGKTIKLCLQCYEKANIEENKLVSKRFLMTSGEKILAKAPVLLCNYPFGMMDSKQLLCYIICFTDNCLIGCYFERYLVPARPIGYAIWQSVHEKELKKKEKEIQFFQGSIKQLVDSNEYNFALTYYDVEEVRFGRLLFSIRLTEEYDCRKMRFDFDINNRAEVVDLFMRFLPTKTIIKKGFFR